MEPARTPWDLNFGLFGTPVRVHPMFWLVGLLLGLNSPTPMALAVWMVALFVSILVHELGHAITMRAYGYYPSITLYGMGGLTSFGPSAYGSRSTGTLGQILISAAGPAAGFALAAVLFFALRLARVDMVVFIGLPYVVLIGVREVVWSAALSEFINDLFFISVFWGLVNLLPIYPLDGGQIAREFLAKINPAEGTRWSLMISLTTACLLALVAFVRWHDLFAAVFFLYLAYWSYATLAAYGGGGRWW